MVVIGTDVIVESNKGIVDKSKLESLILLNKKKHGAMKIVDKSKLKSTILSNKKKYGAMKIVDGLLIRVNWEARYYRIKRSIVS